MSDYDKQDPNYKQEKTLGEQGQEDSLKGKLNQAAGKVQQKVGQTIGNQDMQAKGAARQAGGKVQEVGGGVEKKIDQALQPDDTK